MLHAVEHWDFLRDPQHRPEWLVKLDQQVVESAYFLFGGKAYAIFALMFGISFFITLERWNGSTRNVSGRFLWRLVLLGALGYIHGLLYCGDILTVIAVLGVPLIVLNKLSSRALGVIAILLVLQLPQWADVLRVLNDSTYIPARPYYWQLYERTAPVFAYGTFGDVIHMNSWTGQAAKGWWVVETHRYPQMLGLFVCGLLLGRSGVMQDESRLRRLAIRAVIVGACAFALIVAAHNRIDALGLDGLRRMVVDNLIAMYGNLAQTALCGGGFVLLYQWGRTGSVLRILVPYGRMSLTCYVTQALLGVPFYYGFGLGMYRYVGPFYSLFFAVGVFTLQCALAHWWLERFSYGPLEWLWRAATLRSVDVPMRRRELSFP